MTIFELMMAVIAWVVLGVGVILGLAFLCFLAGSFWNRGRLSAYEDYVLKRKKKEVTKNGTKKG